MISCFLGYQLQRKGDFHVRNHFCICKGSLSLRSLFSLWLLKLTEGYYNPVQYNRDWKWQCLALVPG